MDAVPGFVIVVCMKEKFLSRQGLFKSVSRDNFANRNVACDRKLTDFTKFRKYSTYTNDN